MSAPIVKAVRQRGRSSLSGGGRVVVTVRDSIESDLRAVISITEGQDGITRIMVTPSDVCAVTVNDVEPMSGLTARVKR